MDLGTRIAVVGAGFVGLVSAVVFSKAGYTVDLIEIDPLKCAQLRRGVVPFHEPGLEDAWVTARRLGLIHIREGREATLEALAEADLTVVAVPTPTRGLNGHDVEAVHVVAETWARAQVKHDGKWGAFAIRSTVLPHVPGNVRRTIQNIAQGAADEWNKLLHVPEFLAEGSALHDAQNPCRVVLGWVEPDGVSPEYRDSIAFILTPEGAKTTWRHTTAETASLIKYASNVMLASRLSTIQAIGELAGEVDGDIEEISDALADDPRIGSSFLAAGAGWGGSCFPKDSKALYGLAEEHGLTSSGSMFYATWASNRRLASHWVLSQLDGHIPKKVAWLGLSFKPGTSDIRDSPALMGLELFINTIHSAAVRVHDPEAKVPEAIRTRVLTMGSAIDAARGADLIVLATGWPEYEPALPALLAAAGDAPTIIDCRNMWSPAPADLPKLCVYHGFGKPPVYAL